MPISRMWLPYLLTIVLLLTFIPSITCASIVQGYTARWNSSPYPIPHQFHTCHPLREPHLTLCFGGFTYNVGDLATKLTNDVYILDSTNITNPAWMTPLPYGDAPPGRFSMATYYDRSTNRLFVHGGDQDTTIYQSAAYPIDDGLWILHVDNMTWTHHSTMFPSTSQTSLPRAGHAMVLWNNELWISGGYNATNTNSEAPFAKIPLSDIWRLSLDTMTWTYQGQMGMALYRHKMIRDTIDRPTLWTKTNTAAPPALGSGSSPIFLIFGGMNGTAFTQQNGPLYPPLSLFLMDPNPIPPTGPVTGTGWWTIPSPWSQKKDFVLDSTCKNYLDPDTCAYFIVQEVVWSISLDQRMLYMPTYQYATTKLFPKYTPTPKLMMVDLTTWTFSNTTTGPQLDTTLVTTLQHQVLYQTNGYSITPLGNSPTTSPLLLIYGRDNDLSVPSLGDINQVYVIFNVTSKQYIQPSNLQQLNVSRWGMSATVVGRQVYTFGGHLDRDSPQATNTLDTHDIDSYIWSKPISNGIIPPARGSHFATLLSNGRDILIYGGYVVSPTPTAYNDVYLYNTLNGVWSKPTITGQPPTRPTVASNFGPTYAVMMNDVLVHIHSSDPTDEVHVNPLTRVSMLDTTTWTWTHGVLQQPPNVLLSDYTLTYALGKIWLLGGRINFAQSRRAPFYILDTTTWTWSSIITPSGDFFSGRFGHDAAYITNGRYHVILISVGKTDADSPNVLLDLDSLSMRTLQTFAGGLYSNAPVQSTIYVASTGYIDGRIIQYGGLFYVRNDDPTPNTVPISRVAVLWTGFQTSMINYGTGSDIMCVSSRSPCQSLAWSLRQFSRASIGTYYHDLEYPVDYYVAPAVITEPITVTWHAGIHSMTPIAFPISSNMSPSTLIASLVPTTPTFIAPIMISTGTLISTQTVYMQGVIITNTTLVISQSNSMISSCIIYKQQSYGLNIMSTSYVTVISSLITSNNGAGIMLSGATLNIQYSYISKNNYGVWATSLSTLNIMNTTITSNFGNVMGAGIYATTAVVNMIDVDVINNMIIYDAIDNQTFNVGGGGVALTSSTVTITRGSIVNNTLSVTPYAQNQLTSRGILSMGGGLLSVYSTLTMDSCLINNNTAQGYGGGCAYSLSTISLSNCHINNNIASLSGGGIYTRGSLISTYNNTWSYNMATGGDGGGMMLENTPCSMNEGSQAFTYNVAGGAGGGVFWWPQRPNTIITATQITTNIASYGPLIATPASSLIYLNSTALSQHHTSGQLITPPLVLSLIDTYQQLVTTDNTSIISALPSSVFQGTLFQPASTGMYVMSGLATREPPNNIMGITFSVTTRYVTVTTNTVSLMTRACVPGEFVDLTISQCRLCGVGSFSNTSSAPTCTPCDAGTYQSLTGQTSCIPCDVGYQQMARGTSACTQCDAGRFSNHTGTIKCGPCAAGSFNPTTGRSACTLCAPGTSTDQTGQTVCTQCDAGRYADTNGTIKCTACPAGSFNPSIGRSTCVLCAPGTASNQTAQTECPQCDAGRYSNQNGTTKCSACDAGWYNPSIGRSTCVLCGSGTANDQTGQSSCAQCDAGRFSNGTGITKCTACAAGSFNPSSGRSTCVLCAPGYANNQEGQTACLQCDAGRYADTNATIQCTACPSGSFNPSIGRSTCTLCAPGSAASQEGQSACTLCDAGRYSDQDGTTKCSACGAGLFNPYIGRSTCMSCPPGTGSNQTGQSECTPCAAGYASPYNESTSCQPCDVGTYQPNKGQTSCQQCEIGTFSAIMAAVQCVRCPTGSFQNDTGHSNCNDCQSGTYQDRTGQTTCLLCLAGQTSYPRSTGCVACSGNLVAPTQGSAQCTSCPSLSVPTADHTRCECAIGSYGHVEYVDVDNGTSNGTTRVPVVQCAVCPTGAVCDSVGIMEASLQPQRGYWRTNNSSPDFFQCLTRDTCVGGGMGDNGCAQYRTGPICALCVPGYHAVSSSTQCTSCPSHTTSIGLIFLFIILILLALILMYYSLIRADRIYLAMLDIKSEAMEHTSRIAQARTQQVWAGMNMDMANLTVTDAEQRTKDGVAHEFYHGDYIDAIAHRMKLLTPEDRVPYTFTIAMKILLGFFQILTNVTFISNLMFPPTFVSFINVFSFVNLDSIPFQTVQCIFGLSFYNRMIVVTLVPPILVVALVIFYLLPNYYLAHRDMSDDESRHARYRQHRAQFWKLCAFTLFLVYPSICNHVLSMFACREVAGIKYVQADFSLECHSPEWNRYLPYAILMIIVYPVGVPLLLFVLLAYHRHELDNKYVRLSCGFLYEAYHSNVWWFEIVDLLHKVLLSSVLVFVPPHYQMVVAMCLVMFYTGIILIQQPYIRASDDALHKLAQVELYLIFFFAFILQYETLDDWSQMLLSILLIILVLTMLCIFILHTIMATRQAIRSRQRETQRKSMSHVLEVDTNTETSKNSRLSGTVTPNKHRTGNIEMMTAYKSKSPTTPKERLSNASPQFQTVSSIGLFTLDTPSQSSRPLTRGQMSSSPRGRVDTYYNPHLHPPPRHNSEFSDLSLRGLSTLLPSSQPQPTPTLNVNIPNSSPSTSHRPLVDTPSPHQPKASIEWQPNPLSHDDDDITHTGLYSATGSDSPRIRSVGTQRSDIVPPSPGLDPFARNRRGLTMTSSSLESHETGETGANETGVEITLE